MAPAQEVHRRVRTGCITCRKRHMKCDERKPHCRHCEIGRRDCEYEAVDTSVQREDGIGLFQFSADHVWLDTPSEITFIHSVDVNNGDDEEQRSNPLTLAHTSILANIHRPLHYAAQELSLNLPPPDSEKDDIVPVSTPGPSRDAGNFASPHSIASGASMETIDPVKSLMLRRASGSAIYIQGPAEPLGDPLRARLLHHYINNLACWLDVNDPQRQFETFVPYLAMSCPILLHAVLAFSACHLNRQNGSCDEFCAAHYHDLCVQSLIPALADPSTTLDNVLPISTVILRMHEMMSYETDHQRHLRGCSSLFTHNRNNIGYRALKRTAFWTYFREEIMVALAMGKPTTINPRNWKVDITWGGDTDYVKTEKMTMLTAEVIDYCFSKYPGDHSGDEGSWGVLQNETIAWKDSLPESFDPIYVIDGGEGFPEILYLCTWHIVAMQFYHLVKVLLALHNPHRPSGIGFLQYARAVEDEILRHTIQLCGMTKALGDQYPGALVNAVQPLVVCGQTLKKPEQQAELVRILQRIERVTTLATSQGIQSLEEAWSSHGDL
ncbi:fungal-specific transcription factor domain-containing protein [Trichoderma chlorosporum]